jgi:hypothetical protein
MVNRSVRLNSTPVCVTSIQPLDPPNQQLFHHDKALRERSMLIALFSMLFVVR